MYKKGRWLGSTSEIKKHLEAILFGTVYLYPDGSGNSKDYTGNKLNALYKSNSARFVELIGHYDTLEEADTIRGNKTTSKTVIIYVYIGN